MKEGRRVLNGLLLAVLSIVIILGSVSLSLMESGFAVAQAPEVPASQEIAFRDALATLVYTPPPGSTLVPMDMATSTEVPALDFTPNKTCVMPVAWVTFEVPSGETLTSLASRFQTSPSALKTANCMQGSTLTGGMLIYVPNNPPPIIRPTRTQRAACYDPPYGWVVYIIRHGDTLYSLSRQFGLTVDFLMSANCLTSTYIVTGQRLYVPYLPAPATLYPSATAVPSRTPTRILTQTPTTKPPVAGTPTPTGTPTSTSELPPKGTVTPTSTPAWLPPTSTSEPSPTATRWVPPTPTETLWVPPPQPSDTPWAPPPPSDTPWVAPPQPSDTPGVFPPPDQPPEPPTPYPPTPYPGLNQNSSLYPYSKAAYQSASFLDRLYTLWVAWISSP